jgi:hypothetical protein
VIRVLSRHNQLQDACSIDLTDSEKELDQRVSPPSAPFLVGRDARQAARSPTGMHGQSMACSVAEALLSCSPQLFLHNHGSVRQSPLAFLPARSPHLETAFYSPAATVLFRKPPQRGQTLPAYLFGKILNSSSSPFGLKLLSSIAFSRSWEHSTLKTRCQLVSPELSNVHPTFAPFQDSRPSGS